jgi:hypothetical protein
VIDFSSLPDRKVRVIRDVPADEEGNYGSRTFKEGEVLYKYVGATYGCIDSSEGAPLSEKGSRETPFFQFPHDAFEEIH